jgi:hypothetical protein
MSYYTESQLEIINQYTDQIDEIETMSYGTYTSLDADAIKNLQHSYKIVWLHDDPYEVQLIPKRVIYESML